MTLSSTKPSIISRAWTSVMTSVLTLRRASLPRSPRTCGPSRGPGGGRRVGDRQLQAIDNRSEGVAGTGTQSISCKLCALRRACQGAPTMAVRSASWPVSLAAKAFMACLSPSRARRKVSSVSHAHQTLGRGRWDGWTQRKCQGEGPKLPSLSPNASQRAQRSPMPCKPLMPQTLGTPT